MPRSVTTGLYAFDPLMKNPDNRVVNEKQVLNVPERDDFHFLIPQAAPFFGRGVTVRNETTKEQYVEGQDYVLGHRFVEAMHRTGVEIYGSIRFLKTDIAGIIVLDYHTLGGEWGYDDQTILRELSQRSLNPAVRSWEQVAPLPVSFPPVSHDQDVKTLIGFQDVLDRMDEIVQAINAKAAGTNLDHINNKANPHDVTKTQVGLGDVENFQVASDSEARTGSRADRYMTPRATRLAIEALGLSNIDLHKNDKNNPHSVTKTQVGLSNVQNYGIASVGEAQLRQVNNKYMTPSLTGVAIQRWYDDELKKFFDGTVANATGVTKAQIGLGAVENYPMATDVEAVAGTRDDRYMSPLRTYQSVDRFAVIPLNNHINDKFNPHGVTKAQVGLGLVENYRIATLQQAREGLASDAYMTPATTAEAIRNNAGSDLGNHVNDFDNPHRVDKTQVGLGNVQNYPIASQQQAIEGDLNTVYMTPLRVRDLVTEMVGGDFDTHANRVDNPHNVTKAQVGLSNVENYAPASKEEAEVGSSDARYMTPLRVKEAIEARVGLGLSQHANRTDNPHQVTKAQVGLSNVENYRIANEAEATAGSSNAVYMTPLRVKQAIDTQVTTSIDNHANNTSNPHSVTKAQVGLSNVENYNVANQTEAEAGALNTRYMTPLRVKQAIASEVGTDLRAHLQNANNPHGVTKDQIGLNLVENYPMASEEEAILGESNERYMSPLRVSQMIADLAGESIEGHVANKDNPHGVTKAQVGLSSVANYSVASQAEAEAGTVNTRYMTPLRVAQAIKTTIGSDLQTHIEDQQNPHGVTKAQIGLSNVENYPMASVEEARNLDREDAYLSPSLLGEALTQFQASLVAELFEGGELPFDLTKEMVGLGDVQNFPIATDQQAREGTHGESYMTPALTSVALEAIWEDFNAFVLRRDNPHEVTLDQLGGIDQTALDTALATKLDVNGTAANASQVYGLNQSSFETRIKSFKVADSELLEGKSIADILDQAKTLKVDDSDKFNGKTEAEFSSALSSSIMSQVAQRTTPSFQAWDLGYIVTSSWSPVMEISYSGTVEDPDVLAPACLDLQFSAVTSIQDRDGNITSQYTPYRLSVVGLPGKLDLVSTGFPISDLFDLAVSVVDDTTVRIWVKESGTSPNANFYVTAQAYDMNNAYSTFTGTAPGSVTAFTEYSLFGDIKQAFETLATDYLLLEQRLDDMETAFDEAVGTLEGSSGIN